MVEKGTRSSLIAMALTVGVAAPVLLSSQARDAASLIFGFTAASSAAQRTLEARINALPSEARIEADHRLLTKEPHVAGSPRDKELADWTAQQWRAAGLEDVSIVQHDVLLPYPQEISVELVAPRPWRASMREEPIPGDPDSQHPGVGLPHHAYSASGDVTAEVVYANSGNPADYDWLTSQGIDIKGRIALVRYSVPYSYRGFKALTAQQRGAAGIIIYSDPQDDGFRKGKVYPEGPWGPESHIQRGGIVYDFMVPGDPLTPGWASTPGARRIPAAEATSLPTIVSVPMSYKDARVILEALQGPEAPQAWQGGLPFTYRVGGTAATRVRLNVKNDEGVRPIWTVTGRLRGASLPDEWVILGNHRDAWIFGGVDPSSGSASMMELARTLGTLAKEGHRPKRTIVFASWDAEEYTLTSSTEWGEQFERELSQKAVAYLNVDSSASGPTFSAAAVPSLNRFIEEAAGAVLDPRSGRPLPEARRAADTGARGSLPTGAGDALVNNRLGSGSDYTVFLNFIGVPIVDMTFEGPYGVYHSMYDNHFWVSRVGDPGFKYHAAMTRLWGVMATRLANADRLPFEYAPYAARIEAFLTELEQKWGSRFERARAANARFATAAYGAADNRGLMQAERALLDPAGIPGRPWYRHQIYAPKFTYAPEVLPGLAEAIEARDKARVDRQEVALADALDRATRALAGGGDRGRD